MRIYLLDRRAQALVEVDESMEEVVACGVSWFFPNSQGSSPQRANMGVSQKTDQSCSRTINREIQGETRY